MDYKILPFEKKDIQDSGIFTGYGSTFGGKPDSYGDIIAPGAFTESIVKNGRGGMGIAMLYQHNHTEPIGIWKNIAQDKKGLLMEGQLALKTQRGLETYELMKIGALKGLSIGFDLPRDEDGKVANDAREVSKNGKTQVLKRINLWEVSPVTFAANTRARITGVKNLEEAKTLRELETALRESGLSKSDALYVAKLCRPSLRESGKVDEVSDILETIKSTIETIESFKSVEYDLLSTLKYVNNMLA